MLTRPDSKTIAAIARLSRQSDTEELLKYLDSELETTKDQLLDAVDASRFHRLQGRGRLLKDFLELVRTAYKLVDKPRESGMNDERLRS